MNVASEELDLSMIRSQRVVKIRREFDTLMPSTHRFAPKTVEILIERDTRPLSLRVAAKVRAVYGGEKEQVYSIYDQMKTSNSISSASIANNTSVVSANCNDETNGSGAPSKKSGTVGAVDAEDGFPNSDLDPSESSSGKYGPHTFGNPNLTASSIGHLPKVSTSTLAKEFFSDNVKTYNEAIRSTSDIAKEALKFKSALSGKDSKKFACRYQGCHAAFYLSFQCTVHEQTVHGEDRAFHNNHKPQRRVPKVAYK